MHCFFQIIFFFPLRQSGLIPYALIHYSRGRVFQLTHILPFSIPLFYMTQPFCISPSLPNENVICNQPYFFISEASPQTLVASPLQIFLVRFHSYPRPVHTEGHGKTLSFRVSWVYSFLFLRFVCHRGSHGLLKKKSCWSLIYVILIFFSSVGVHCPEIYLKSYFG